MGQIHKKNKHNNLDHNLLGPLKEQPVIHVTKLWTKFIQMILHEL